MRTASMVKFLLAVIFIGVLFIRVPAQNGDPPRTTTTDPDYEVNKRKEGPPKTRLLQIIKNDTKGILYGNKCFEDFTRDRGYEYVVQPKGNARNRKGINRFFHNFGVKFVIFFKNGPFWKFKENKRKKECRTKTGDYVG